MTDKKKKSVAKYNLDEAEDLWGSILSDDESAGDDDSDLFLDDLLTEGDYPDAAVEDLQAFDSPDDAYDDLTVPYDDDYSSEAPEREQAFDSYDETYDDGVSHDDSSSDLTSEYDGVDDVYEEEDGSDTVSLEEPLQDEMAEDEEAAEEAAAVTPEPTFCSALLEFIGGVRQEVSRAKLFEPMENSLLTIDEETGAEQVVFFDQLTCLHVSDLPADIGLTGKVEGTPEIIETGDGRKYRVRSHSVQDRANLLFCSATDDQAPYRFTLIPQSGISKRTLDKPLTEILLEKRFISRMMLQQAQQEYEQIKGMTLERIIAQKARIPLAEIEETLAQAAQNQMLGLQKEEMLLISGIANEEEILGAVEELEQLQKVKIGQFMVDKGIVSEAEVYLSLAEKHMIPFIDLAGRKISRKSFELLPKNLVVQHEILPLALKDDIMLVASHFVDMSHLGEVIAQAAACKQVRFVLSPPSQIRKIINLLYPEGA